MTKNRTEKQNAHDRAEQAGIPYVAAKRQGRDAPAPADVPKPQFALSTVVRSDGRNEEGMPFQTWQVNIRAFKDEEADDYDEGTEESIYDTAGSAVAVLYPNALDSGGFSLDMDASDEAVTAMGEYVVAGENEGYSGNASSSLFDDEIFGIFPDLLLIGDIVIEPNFRGGNYPVMLVNALLRIIGRETGAVVLTPSGRGENSTTYWMKNGFTRYGSTPVFVFQVDGS
ncbi:hypothetical protein [Cryobacterium zhongshanensis]|uniref:Uncharacterized protein n=1 Tax=Cryobacterium zhongshanensis TaxID=2928153 RepID=A0AA41UGZ2_9MICO|nr:hypothetical protein [Cryobacterium zhongshanensis]MCI4659722.1 hypothetical protein [Cryobacterium zhongshanensis]